MMKSAAVPYQGEERRKTFRRRSLIRATVVWDNRMSTFDVLIRNRSKDGFLLETENSPSIPNQFSLNIPGEPGELRCRVIWRSGRSLGARIVTRAVAEKPVALATAPADANQELRARLAERFPHLSKKR